MNQCPALSFFINRARRLTNRPIISKIRPSGPWVISPTKNLLSPWSIMTPFNFGPPGGLWKIAIAPLASRRIMVPALALYYSPSRIAISSFRWFSMPFFEQNLCYHYGSDVSTIIAFCRFCQQKELSESGFSPLQLSLYLLNLSKSMYQSFF